MANLTRDRNTYDEDADSRHSPSSSSDTSNDSSSLYNQGGQDDGSNSSSSGSDDKDKDQKDSLYKREQDATKGSGAGADASSDENSFFAQSRHDRRRAARGFSRRNKAILGSGVGVGGILLSILFTFAPILKLEFIFQGIQERVGAVGDYAVGERVDVLFGNYMTRKFFQAGNNNVYVGDTLYGTLYGNWASAKFENTLHEKYGIKFDALDANGNLVEGTKRAPTKWQVSINDVSPTVVNSRVVNLDSIDKDLNKHQIKRVIKQALKNETRFYQVIKRVHMWRIMKNKYQVPDRLVPQFITDKKASYREKKLAAKKWLFTRATGAFSSNLGALVGCIIDNRDCGDILNRRTAAEAELTAQQRAEIDAEIDRLERQIANASPADRPGLEARLSEQTAKLGDALNLERQAAEAAEELFEGTAREGFEGVFADSKLVKVFTSTITKRVLASIGVIGAIDFLSRLLEGLESNSIGQAVYDMKTLNYINSVSPYLTATAQIRNGELDSERAGLLVESFDGFESSIIYQKEINGTNTAVAEAFTGETVSAQETRLPYDCDGDGEIDPDPQTSVDYVTTKNPVCSRMILANDYTLFTSEPWYENTVGLVFDAYRNTIGRLVGWAVEGIDAIAGALLEPILEASGATQALTTGIEYMASKFVSPACTNLEQGALSYDCARGAIELMDNAVVEETLNGLGGAYQTAEDRNLVIDHQMNIYEENWKRESLFARLFSTDSHRSLLAKSIIKTPTSATNTISSLAKAVTSPLSSMSSLARSIFSPVSAQDTLPADYNPYSIVHYGYGLGDPNLQDEPGTGVYANCETGGYDNYESIREQEIEDWSFGDEGAKPGAAPWPVPSTPNYCALERTAVESAGALIHSLEAANP